MFDMLDDQIDHSTGMNNVSIIERILGFIVLVDVLYLLILHISREDIV